MHKSRVLKWILGKHDLNVWPAFVNTAIKKIPRPVKACNSFMNGESFGLLVTSHALRCWGGGGGVSSNTRRESR